MAYLEPHFDSDIFVSYSRGDPSRHGDSPLKRWTEMVMADLQSDIQSVSTEFDQLHVWMDEQIDRTAPLTAEVRDKVKSSGILMIFMSPRYLTSKWCKDELGWFRDQIRERSGEQGRVFVIRATATDESTWPDFLRDERGNSLIGYLFHDPISQIPYGWRDTNERNVEYSKQLWTLKTALTTRLRELRQRYESRPAVQPAAFFAPPADLPAAPVAAGGRRRVYLHARGEQDPARNEVQHVLSQLNIIPLSVAVDKGNALMDWTREASARRETVKRCDALALVRSDANEGFIGDLFDIGIDERERIQAERGSPLPCAVLDRSGEALPVDVSAFGIRHFDIARTDWQGEFGTWLQDARRPNGGEP
jgi:hypothetical protein